MPPVINKRIRSKVDPINSCWNVNTRGGTAYLFINSIFVVQMLPTPNKYHVRTATTISNGIDIYFDSLFFCWPFRFILDGFSSISLDKGAVSGDSKSRRSDGALPFHGLFLLIAIVTCFGRMTFETKSDEREKQKQRICLRRPDSVCFRPINGKFTSRLA